MEVVTKDNVKLGDAVTRGPSWVYKEQDGGEGSIGVVTSLLNLKADEDGEIWIKIKWENEDYNDYRVHPVYDLNFADIPERPISDYLDELDERIEKYEANLRNK